MSDTTPTPDTLRDLKTGIGLYLAQWAARQEMGVQQKTLAETLFGVVDEWASKLAADPSGEAQEPAEAGLEGKWSCDLCAYVTTDEGEAREHESKNYTRGHRVRAALAALSAKPEPEEPPKMYAPWTDKQVARLNDRQMSLHLHPYTCPECSTELMAERAGWRCGKCHKTTQVWALAADSEPAPEPKETP